MRWIQEASPLARESPLSIGEAPRPSTWESPAITFVHLYQETLPVEDARTVVLLISLQQTVRVLGRLVAASTSSNKQISAKVPGNGPCALRS